MMNRNKQGLKKYRGLLAALVLVTMVICGCSRLQTQKSAETELAEGQRKAEIQVVSITGNELTYIEVEEDTEAESEQGRAQSDVTAGEGSQISQTSGADRSGELAQGGSRGGRADQMPGGMNGEMPQMNQEGENSQEGGQMPVSMEFPEGMSMPEGMELPDGMSMPEGMELPDGMSMPEGMELPEEMDVSGDAAASGFFENAFKSSAETVTVYLPVGIKVHTGNGKTSTFSILEAGDQLEVLFEENKNSEEVITEIWLLGIG